MGAGGASKILQIVLATINLKASVRVRILQVAKALNPTSEGGGLAWQAPSPSGILRAGLSGLSSPLVV